MNCKPNDVCVIISEMSDCEDNIGAIITVVEHLADPMYGDCWTFKDASRPLVIRNMGISAYHSYEREGSVFFVRDRDLIPIQDPDLDTSDSKHEELTECHS